MRGTAGIACIAELVGDQQTTASITFHTGRSQLPKLDQLSDG